MLFRRINVEDNTYVGVFNDGTLLESHYQEVNTKSIEVNKPFRVFDVDIGDNSNIYGLVTHTFKDKYTLYIFYDEPSVFGLRINNPVLLSSGDYLDKSKYKSKKEEESNYLEVVNDIDVIDDSDFDSEFDDVYFEDDPFDNRPVVNIPAPPIEKSPQQVVKQESEDKDKIRKVFSRSFIPQN